MRLIQEETVALLIDIQERLLPVMHERDELVLSTVRFIEGLKILQVPVIPVRQYPKGLGDLTPEIRTALGDYEPSDKTTFSAWDTPEIASRIQAMGKKNVLVFGIEAHICVLLTVIDLIEAGFHVVLVSDCTSSRRPYDKEIALRRAEQEGAVLSTGESILFELLRKAGSDTFKQISALVK